uniref:S-phase kinase-associated protein 1-like n=1 Tax=Myxine glutinosa TaxID=7769 RepID=UPI00358F3B54
MPSIKLQSSDGEVFEVDVEIAKQLVTIKTMLDDLGMDEEGDDEPVPLPNVNAAILRKVVQWCSHHKDDPPPPEDDENKEKRTDDIPVWDQEFLKVYQGTLFELILAANYLDIKGLLDVTCKTVANMMKGKTPGEIRETFNIKNDFTEEEEQQCQRQHSNPKTSLNLLHVCREGVHARGRMMKLSKKICHTLEILTYHLIPQKMLGQMVLVQNTDILGPKMLMSSCPKRTVQLEKSLQQIPKL